MFDDRTSRLVGVAALAVLAAAAAFVVLLDRIELRPGLHVEVYFEHLGHLREGADVQVAGREIGRIEDVRLIPQRLAEDPDHPLHGTGGVAVRARIEQRYADWAPENGEFFISSKGILGEAYLEIGPPPADEPIGRPIADGDRVRGVDPPRLDRVMLRSYQNLVASRRFLEAVRPEAEALAEAAGDLADTLREIQPEPGAWSRLGASLAELAGEGRALAADLERGELDPARVRALVRRGRAFFDRAREDLGRLRAHFGELRAELERVGRGVPGELRPKLERAVAEARASFARLEGVAARAQALLARIERGQGTVGAILNDPEFIDDAKELGKIIKRQPWRVVGHPPPE